MQQLNMITQENASSSDELTQSSDSLAHLANNLREAVSYFNIGDNEEAIELGKPSFVKQTSASKPVSKDHPRSSNPNPFTNFDKDFDLDNYEKY